MSKFLKSLCKIAIPVTLQSMLQSSFSIVDQIMIGQLGETNISAVGLCGNFSLIFSVMIGVVSTVAGILIAQFIGAEESKEAWCSFDVSLICGIIMSVLPASTSCRTFIKQPPARLEAFGEALVKRWLERIIVWEDHFTVELKSGLKIEIEG